MLPSRPYHSGKLDFAQLSNRFIARLQVRERIEMSGRGARWEFAKPLLFSRTNYIADICGHLVEMVAIVDDFFMFLGPELKAVTGDAEGIDAVIARVDAMVGRMENAPFNIFEPTAAGQWNMAKMDFLMDNDNIKVSHAKRPLQHTRPFQHTGPFHCNNGDVWFV